MAHVLINSHRIKVDWTDALINSFLFLWADIEGPLRKTPRNIYSYDTCSIGFGMAVIFLPIAWLFSHLPFIWPEAYEGYDTHYGEKKVIHSSYQEALCAERAKKERDNRHAD